jgi:DUF971 family protein
MSRVSEAPTPTRLHLKRTERLEIDWSDGRKCVYPIDYLRSMCPCAQCRTVREGDPHRLEVTPQKKPLLTILPGNYANPLAAVGAELVGNYALRIDWSDEHGSGIYSFQYLREICPPEAKAEG